MEDRPRLIERAFPLKQTSLDSVHEKNVRHGHISTLHIWPARRPLAACRAALIATLLPDPRTPEARKKLCEKFAGKVVEKEKKVGGETRIVEETEGGILHWQRETENADTLEWFRQEIRKAYGGRAPKVLDPFAGGGAIPLEAMRLGCEVTASDLNPVAWFILKCTLEYPQKLAGQTRPLPDFILSDREFMTSFFESQGLPKKEIAKALEKLGHEKTNDPHLPGMERADVSLEADLAWHVRAWGQRVLDQARRKLAPFYPTYADFEPLGPGLRSYEKQPTRLVPPNEDGTLHMDALNGGFSSEYLAEKGNPRWVPKPTIAYLWARTVKCKNCRATIPLLKSRWLWKGRGDKVVLTMAPLPDGSGVTFGIERTSSVKSALTHGTITRAGARCPCCDQITTTEDIRLEGKAGRLGQVLTAVAVDGSDGREFRQPTDEELDAADRSYAAMVDIFAELPFGRLLEPMPNEKALGMRVPKYGFDRWEKMFAPRQLLGLGVLSQQIISTADEMAASQYPDDWTSAIRAYLACGLDRAANYLSTLCIWEPAAGEVKQTFLRFALPITWDFAEANPLSATDRFFAGAISGISRVLSANQSTLQAVPSPHVEMRSATCVSEEKYDIIVTDPPYYDAIPYSDLMDFFYVWLRRTLHGLSVAIDEHFSTELCPKWDGESNDGELIDDASRHGSDPAASKHAYEDGMFRAFRACCEMLHDSGRLVIVFANKQPDAWETLVAAIIRAGFVVDGSWPVMTEMRGGVRNFNRASLASSVWLVCRKRLPCRAGWAKPVLDEMHGNIAQRLTEFWDAGIRGPDFVWAALGPALEAYSKFPVVRTDDPNTPTMSVQDFLSHVRRIVIDFVVGRVLTGGEASDMEMADRLDGVTAYYLLHRNDFGMDLAPSGACILYALSCGVSDHDLTYVWNLTDSASGSEVRLVPWKKRKGKNLGVEAPGGREMPIIDRIHRVMHLWMAGDVQKVDAYLDDNALRRNELFRRVLQAIIELADEGSEERSLLESISNHIQGKGAVAADNQTKLEI